MYIYIYIYVIIYKSWLVGVFDKYTTQVWGQRKFATDKPELKGLEAYQWQTSDDWGQGSYVSGIHHSSHGSYDIYYGDVILILCRLYLE